MKKKVIIAVCPVLLIIAVFLIVGCIPVAPEGTFYLTLMRARKL